MRRRPCRSNEVRGSCVARSLVAALCVAAVTCGAGRVAAQNQAYCTVTGVEVEQLSNAVRVTIQADGALHSLARWWDFHELVENRWEMKQTDVIPFRLTNARSGVGNFVDISAYPVSYLKLSTPLDAREGVGLECELVLYTKASPGRVRTNEGRFGGRRLRGEVQFDMENSSDRTAMYITVISGKHVVLKEDDVEAERRDILAELSVQPGRDSTFSIRAVNADLQQALQQVGEITSERIIVDDGVHRRLTCRLTDIDLAEFLRTTAYGYGLAVARRDGFIYVSNAIPDNVASYWLSSSVPIPLRHLSAGDALQLLPEYVLRFVRPNDTGNALVATGPPPLVEKIRADIHKLDQRGLQISVRVVLVELGTEMSAQRDLEAAIAGGTTDYTTSSTGTGLRFGVLQQRLSEIRARLKFLRRRGEVKLHVEPHLTVASGEEAEFFFGEKQYFKFKRVGSQGPELSIEAADVGVRLKVTPWGAVREHITVPMTVEASNIMSVGAGGLPRVARRKATSCLALGSGDTIIVGGLELTSPTTTRQHTPREITPWPFNELAANVIHQGLMRRAVILLQVDAQG